MPDISGIMDGDFHVIQTKDELSVSSNLKIDHMVYEKCPMGNADFLHQRRVEHGGNHT